MQSKLCGMSRGWCSPRSCRMQLIAPWSRYGLCLSFAPRYASDACPQAPGSRAFVRPSGTEDCVRVYAEAPSPEAADVLQKSIERAIREALVDAADRPSP